MPLTEAEEFIYREARLLDGHEYARWVQLWTEDALYWVPWGSDDIDPTRDVSIIYDRLPQIQARIERLESGKAFAQLPPSRLCRLVSNVEAEQEADGQLVVHSTFMLGEFRMGREIFWFGRMLHRLRRIDGTLKMTFKKVMLLNNDAPIPNLAFLI